VREAEQKAHDEKERKMDAFDHAARALASRRSKMVELSEIVGEVHRRASEVESSRQSSRQTNEAASAGSGSGPIPSMGDDDRDGSISGGEHVEHVDRFTTRTIVYGHQADAALGIEHFMGISTRCLLQLRLMGLEGVRAEFEALRDEEAIECMRYVLDGEAGSCTRLFPNSPYPMDCGPSGLLAERMAEDGSGGMRLVDFCLKPEAQLAMLEPVHVAALRIYTTAAFAQINNPLRDLGRKERGEAHPLPLTTALLRDAVSKLRAVSARGDTANAEVDLWRGMRNVEVIDGFKREGGTELAPLSATFDVAVAVRYAISEHAVLLRLRTRSSMERGADIAWISAFPSEAEVLFPPLVYLQPVGDESKVQLAGVNFRVLAVEPRM